MANNSKPTLAEQFLKAVTRNCGSQVNADIYRAQAATLCEKFELLWDIADDKEKKELAQTMSATILATAMQIRTQTTAEAVSIQADAAGELFLKLQELAPDYIAQSRLNQDLAAEAVKLKTVAGLQNNTLARAALLGASNTMCLMVLASPDRRAPAAAAMAPRA